MLNMDLNMNSVIYRIFEYMNLEYIYILCILNVSHLLLYYHYM